MNVTSSSKGVIHGRASAPEHLGSIDHAQRPCNPASVGLAQTKLVFGGRNVSASADNPDA
jgi:hypothetical protein